MSVTVELSYDMSKAFGARRVEVTDAATVQDAVTKVDSLFQEKGQEFRQLSKVVAVAVNGVLVNHRKGMKTKLSDGDKVSFVKAASGG